MEGLPPPAERVFTLEDYARFLGGDGNPEIVAALQTPESPASQYLAGMRFAASNLLGNAESQSAGPGNE